MNLAGYRRTMRYDAWANDAVATHLAQVAAPPPNGVRWLAHLAGAGWLWLHRVRNVPPRLDVWPELGLPEAHRELTGLGAAWGEMLEQLLEDDLHVPVAYVNSKGEPWESTVADILTHVTVHGAYHRGQIASAVRAAGFEPVYTDFIHAARRGLIV